MAIHPSPRYAVLLLLSHLAAVCLVCLSDLTPSIMWFLSLLVSGSLFYHLARDVLLLLPGSWRALLIEHGEISVACKDGSSLQGRVVGSSFVSPHFVVLRVSSPGAHWTSARVIFPDAMEGDAYRELCVRLKFP